jgi:hypothetical protein
VKRLSILFFLLALLLAGVTIAAVLVRAGAWIAGPAGPGNPPAVVSRTF